MNVALQVEQLSLFAEDRYLHQTTVREQSGLVRFYEDLPLAIQQFDPESQDDVEMRVHFHVPIYLDSFDHLKTSRAEIPETMAIAGQPGYCNHFEVETYAWNVLPQSLRQSELADGIAKELQWFRSNFLI